MKKLLLMFLVFLASCVHLPKGSIEEIDGFQWKKMKTRDKIVLAIGYIMANESAKAAVYYTMPFPDEAKDLLLRYLDISDDPEEVIEKVDDYYRMTESYEALVWSVIYVVYGRNWWPLIEIKKDEEEIVPLVS